MPGGHIFHGDLAWPWAPTAPGWTPPPSAGAWPTDVANVLLCGSGARRGGAVSGLGGHNAAQAVLASRGPARSKRAASDRGRGRAEADFFRGARSAGMCSPRFTTAPLAQLAEQLTLNQRVRGSSP